MKKVIAMGLVLVSLLGMLVSCSAFTCDLCGEEKKGKKHTQEVFGQELVYCHDCYKELKEISEEIEDLG